MTTTRFNLLTELSDVTTAAIIDLTNRSSVCAVAVGNLIGSGARRRHLEITQGEVAATANITFSLIAAGDKVTVGSTVLTGANSPTGAEFQTNVTPSAAADKVAAASLAALINSNVVTNKLFIASNVAGTAVVNLVAVIPGVASNFIPVVISAHGVVSGSVTGPTNTYLLTASSYAVLAQSAITNTGNTILNGDLGISPAAGSNVTGFPPGLVNGVTHLTDAAAAQAHTDATAAEVTLAALVTASNTDISSQDLGGYTAVPGNYKASAAGTWSAGPLTLNGAGTYIFQFVTSLTLPANATIILANGATADNVYFITGTTFIFGADNTTFGTVLAGSAITTASNTNHTGRLLTYGVSGTAVTFPSAAVISNPLVTTGLSGGTAGVSTEINLGLNIPPVLF